MIDFSYLTINKKNIFRVLTKEKLSLFWWAFSILYLFRNLLTKKSK